MPSDRPRRAATLAAAAVLALVAAGCDPGPDGPPGAASSRPVARPLEVGSSITLRTVDGDRALVAQAGGAVRVTGPGPDATDRRAATLLVRAGRGDPSCVTLESRRWPGRVLRQAGSGVRFDVPDGSPRSAADATFCPSIGAGGLALRTLAGSYLRVSGDALDLAGAGTTFAVADPLWRGGADVRVGRVALAPVSAPSRFLRTGPGDVALGAVTPSSPAGEQLAAAVTIVPGLAQESCSSFRSVTDPGAYLRASGAALRAERPGDPDRPAPGFAADATFCAEPGRTGTGLSWRSYVDPGQWLGATGDRVRLTSDGDAAATTWKLHDGTWNAPEWIASWGCALTPAAGLTGPDGLTDATLRQVAHLSRGGDAVRVRLSNRYGDRPLTLGRSTVSISIGGSSIDPTTLTRLTFGGRPAVTVPPGQEVVSDPADLAVRNGAGLAVSLYLPGPTGPLSMHRTANATTYAAQGDTAGADGKLPPLDGSRYLLTGVEVRTAGSRAVSFFGDSLTDGAYSSPDADRRYPDHVVRTLPSAAVFGVDNSGIGGNQLLQQGADPLGRAGVARFAADVLDRPGVRDVVVDLGINDLRADGRPTAAQILAGYREIVKRAHARGVRVTGATLAPNAGHSGHTAAGERVRQDVNAAIRAGEVFDAVADLDATLRDPAAPQRLRPGFDSGDHLHPNDAGYAAMGATVRGVLQGSWETPGNER